MSSIDPVEYVDFDEIDVLRVGCMLCNATISTRQWIYDADGKPLKEVLMHLSHRRVLPVTLEDGSYASVLLCSECGFDDSHIPQIEKTIKWGWQRAWIWKFVESEKKENRQAYKRIKDFFGVGEGESKLPLRVWKHLFKNKSIVKRGFNVIPAKRI